MQFDNGIFKAPTIEPMTFGLFNSCALVKHTTIDNSDAEWVRGFAQELETSPNLVANVAASNATLDTFVTNPGVKRFINIKPFFIELEDYASTFGFLGLDRRERVLRQLEGMTQKAVEREFWEGTIAAGENGNTNTPNYTNPYLRDSNCVVLNNGNAVAPHVALALLEFYIGQYSPAGEQGYIHMTRDVATVLGGGWSINRIEQEDGTIQLQSDAGTVIVIGSGYTGNGPISAGAGAPASDTVKWIYATGVPIVHLGDSEVVNDNTAQAYDVTANQNNLRFKAIRPAAAYFDTSIHLAVKVDLTKTAY